MHSASVLVIGLAILGLELVSPDRIYPWVTLATGVLVVAMGAALAVVRLREARNGTGPAHHHHGHVHDPMEARVPAMAGVGATSAPGPALFAPSHDDELADAGLGHHDHGQSAADADDAHAHDGGDHEHGGHGHNHTGGAHGPERRPDLDRPLSRRGLAGLAVAGGILPSPTAIVVLLATFSAHRVTFGLSLIVSFSVGMAIALVAVGVVALKARTSVARRLSGRLLWAIPVATAFVIAGVGVYLTVKGATGI